MLLIYSFYAYFLAFYVLLTILCHVFVNFCVLFLRVYIVVYFLFMCSFTDHYHRVENRLQLINTIPYNRHYFTN
jgi:hypothetical protein